MKVACTTLTDEVEAVVVEKAGLGGIGMMSIDVEGAEEIALKGLNFSRIDVQVLLLEEEGEAGRLVKLRRSLKRATKGQFIRCGMAGVTAVYINKSCIEAGVCRTCKSSGKRLVPPREEPHRYSVKKTKC